MTALLIGVGAAIACGVGYLAYKVLRAFAYWGEDGGT